MTRRISNQLALTPAPIEHAHARELDAIGDALDSMPGLVKLVEADLCGDADPEKGRPGMPPDQVLRIAILKQLTGFSYAQLEFHLSDSSSYRRFCKVGLGDRQPRRSTLQLNVKRLRAETLEKINCSVAEWARDRGIEAGQTVRVDSTVVKANIHAPYDSWLLRDTVRALAAVMRRAERYGAVFKDHTRVAKRRDLAIHNARNADVRKGLYRDLLKVTRKTIVDARRIRGSLRRRTDESKRSRQARRLAARLEQYIELGERVIDQTERRVLRDDKVPATEKIVSIFEPHADVVVKDRRETNYGHKITIVAGKSGLVTAATIHDGNPTDSKLAWPMIQKHAAVFESVPDEAAFDGGFTSRANLDKLKADGVRNVAFTKSGGLTVEEMVEDKRAFRRLRNFRAGIEGNISHLKRVFGLARCTWKGRDSFHAYVRVSILAANSSYSPGTCSADKDGPNALEA